MFIFSNLKYFKEFNYEVGGEQIPSYDILKINEGFCVSKLNTRNSYLIK